MFFDQLNLAHSVVGGWKKNGFIEKKNNLFCFAKAFTHLNTSFNLYLMSFIYCSVQYKH